MLFMPALSQRILWFLSYNRFVELMPMSFLPMILLLKFMSGKQTRQYYIDSTKLVCHNLRIYRHKTFQNIAKRAKTSMGWFFGMKIHIIINQQGEIMNFMLTLGNIDDRNVVEHSFWSYRILSYKSFFVSVIFSCILNISLLKSILFFSMILNPTCPSFFYFLKKIDYLWTTFRILQSHHIIFKTYFYCCFVLMF